MKDWSQVNDTEYKRSEWEGRTFRALLLLRGLGPEMKISPYEEDSNAARNKARRLHR